jgi:hypothetical protein
MFTSTDALPHWPSGMLLWPNRRLGLGDLCCSRTNRCCSDNAVSTEGRQYWPRHVLADSVAFNRRCRAGWRHCALGE